MTIGSSHYVSWFQACCLNNKSWRQSISETSPQTAMSSSTLRLWYVTSGKIGPLSVRIGNEWVWRGLSVILKGGVRHKALVVGSVSLWRRLLASPP